MIGGKELEVNQVQITSADRNCAKLGYATMRVWCVKASGFNNYRYCCGMGCGNGSFKYPGYAAAQCDKIDGGCSACVETVCRLIVGGISGRVKHRVGRGRHVNNDAYTEPLLMQIGSR